LDFYSQDAMESIVSRGASLLSAPIEDNGIVEIARRARGTPRVALRLLRRVRDFAQVKGDGNITESVASDALALLEIDELGLDEIDRRVLRVIAENYGGGPVGLDTIAAAVSEEADTIMDVYEPYLLQLGFLERTSRGRIATPAAFTHLSIPVEPPEQGRLF
jgi:Holliday junction DNA helicase RuvB